MVERVRLRTGVPSLLVASLVVFCSVSISSGAPSSGSVGVELEGYVRAIQGDTLDARMSNRRIGIGVAGIRAPKANTPCGREATAFLQGLVADGARVEEESGVVSDKYRRVYRVSALDGRSLAEEMVAAGLAYADGRGQSRDRLADLESEARAARRGCLWQSATP